MTKKQNIALQADWWPSACRAQGWKVGDRAMKLRVVMWIVSLVNPSQHELLEAINSDRQPERWLESTSDLTDENEITAVKKCLGMLADNVAATNEVGRPEFNRARQLRWKVRQHLKCLALFVPKPRAYLAEIVNDKFNAWRKYGPPVSIKDLTAEPIVTKGGKRIPSQLDQLMMRVAAVVNQKRNENVLAPAWQHMQGTEPLTIHEMKLTAGADCDCAVCARLGRVPLVPPLEENWADFDPELEPAGDADCELGAAVCEEGVNPF